MLRKLSVPIRIVALAMLSALALSAQNHYIVRLSHGNINTVASRYSMQVVASLTGSANGLYVLNSSLPSSQALAILAADSSIAHAEVDASLALPEVAKGAVNPSSPSQLVSTLGGWIAPYVNKFQIDPYTHVSEWSPYVNQPASGIIGIPAAHQLASGSGTVAILDTGIDFTHPVLASSVVMGWDFVNNIPGGYATPFDFTSASFSNWSSPAILDQSTTPILDDDYSIVLDQSTTPILDDDGGWTLNQSTTPILDGIPTAQPVSAYGHGTMVAGIVHLVAPTARLMPVKVFDANGGSSLSLIIEGIYYAVDHGAKVVNMSFSFTQSSAELLAAINYANTMNVIVVAAAGNQGQSIMVYPAGYSQVLGVGSTNNQNNRSTFSNYGPVVSLAAPGEGVITTYPQNMYAAGWGTSFSTPMVSGAAALLLQLNPQIDPAKAVKDLSKNATQVTGQQFGGAGLLNLPLALGAVKSGN